GTGSSGVRPARDSGPRRQYLSQPLPSHSALVDRGRLFAFRATTALFIPQYATMTSLIAADPSPIGCQGPAAGLRQRETPVDAAALRTLLLSAAGSSLFWIIVAGSSSDSSPLALLAAIGLGGLVLVRVILRHIPQALSLLAYLVAIEPIIRKYAGAIGLTYL